MSDVHYLECGTVRSISANENVKMEDDVIVLSGGMMSWRDDVIQMYAHTFPLKQSIGQF